MIRKATVVLLGIGLFAAASCVTTPTTDFKLPKYTERKLSNSLPIIMIPDSSLPYLSFVLLIKSGSGADVSGQTGLAYLVGRLMDKGTQTRSAVQIADDIENLGADFSVSVEHDYTIISLSGLSFHQEKLITQFGEILTEPAFKDEEISREKLKVLASLKKEVDNPSSFAGSNFMSYLFGVHPYARREEGNARDVKNLKRKDIIKHYFQHYRPNNSVLAVVGRFDSSLIPQLESKIGEWSPRPQKDVTYPSVTDVNGIQIELINKNDLEQTQIRMGHMGIARSNPDYLTLKVANSILGEGMGSRLFKEIRGNRGLTYGIYSYFIPRRDRGPFLVTTFSRHEKVGETIQESLNVIKKFRDSGATEQEVADAKSFIIGTFPQVFETPEGLAQNLLLLRFHGLSDDFLQDYIRNIAKISVQDVNRVIKKYFLPDNMKILVFGKKDSILQQLRPIGIVKVKEYQEVL